MAQFAHKHDLSLGSILSELETEGIEHKFEGERVYFQAQPQTAQAQQGPRPTADILKDLAQDIDMSGLDPSAMKDMSSSDVHSQAQSLMGKMSPEQLSAISNKVASLDPEERTRLMELAKMFGMK